MRRAHLFLALSLLLALLLPGAARAQWSSAQWAPVQPSAAATAAACTADSYAALPSGQDDGTICAATDTGLVWSYDTATGLWLPPGVNPSSLIIDYDGSVLPTAATPAWTKEGTEDCAVASSILTCTDDGGDYALFYRVDAVNFAVGKNVGYIVRERITAQSAGAASTYKDLLAVKAGTAASGYLANAYGTALSQQGDVVGVLSSGALSYAAGAPDNAAWLNYYILYDATTAAYHMGVLGSREYWVIPAAAGTASYLQNSAVHFGGLSNGETCTFQVDWIKVFNF